MLRQLTQAGLLSTILILFAVLPAFAQGADTLEPDATTSEEDILDLERIGEAIGHDVRAAGLKQYVRGDFLLCDAYYQVKDEMESGGRELREDLCTKRRQTAFRLTGQRVKEHFYVQYAQYHSERLTGTWFDQIKRYVRNNREDNIDTRWGPTVVERSALDFPELGDDTFVFTETFTAGGKLRKTAGEIFIRHGDHIVYISQFTLLTDDEPDYSLAEKLGEYLLGEIPEPTLFERRG